MSLCHHANKLDKLTKCVYHLLRHFVLLFVFFLTLVCLTNRKLIPEQNTASCATFSKCWWRPFHKKWVTMRFKKWYTDWEEDTKTDKTWWSRLHESLTNDTDSLFSGLPSIVLIILFDRESLRLRSRKVLLNHQKSDDGGVTLFSSICSSRTSLVLSLRKTILWSGTKKKEKTNYNFKSFSFFRPKITTLDKVMMSEQQQRQSSKWMETST